QDEYLADGQIKHAQVSVALVRTRTSTVTAFDRAVAGRSCCRRPVMLSPAGQPKGLAHEASRANPRDIRFQKPGGLSCGRTPITVSTVRAGASAITVYTMPRLDQVSERWSGSAA